MTFILCCPPNWADILAGRRGPSQILGGNWIDMGTNQGNFPEMGYGTWGAAVDFCVSQVWDSQIDFFGPQAPCPVLRGS